MIESQTSKTEGRAPLQNLIQTVSNALLEWIERRERALRIRGRVYGGSGHALDELSRSDALSCRVSTAVPVVHRERAATQIPVTVTVKEPGRPHLAA